MADHDKWALHQGIKEYSCDSCGKLLSTAKSLKVHKKTVHLGEKNYKCDICGKLFSRRKGLTIHVNSVHEGLKDSSESLKFI